MDFKLNLFFDFHACFFFFIPIFLLSRFGAEQKLDYREWNGTLPALTFCYHNRVDEVKTEYLIKRLWNIESNDVEYSYFYEYVSTVANASISSLEIFKKYASDKRLAKIDLSIIVKDVHPNINSIVFAFDPNINPHISEVLTEKGLCYSVNAVFQTNMQGTR